jgi:2,3-bisphosphoglycerate-dependent phosphoglycerate mutase
MKLLLVRHGQTIENTLDIVQGWILGTLSVTGKEQVKQLASRLAQEKIDVIYSSDLGRTKATTAAIITFHKDTPVHYTEALREINTSKFANKKTTEINWNDVEHPGHVKKRIKDLLDIVYTEHKDKTVLFVTHGGINRVFFTIFEGKKAEEWLSLPPTPNAALSIIDMTDNTYTFTLVNDTTHIH